MHKGRRAERGGGNDHQKARRSSGLPYSHQSVNHSPQNQTACNPKTTANAQAKAAKAPRLFPSDRISFSNWGSVAKSNIVRMMERLCRCISIRSEGTGAWFCPELNRSNPPLFLVTS